VQLQGSTDKKIKNGFRICDGQKENCADLTAFKTQKGRVVTFKLNDKPLDQSIKALNQTSTDNGLTFTSQWAYLTTADTLRLFVDLRNDGDKPIQPDGSGSVFIDASGRQHMNRFASVGEAIPVINAHATATMIMDFDGADQINGRAIVKAYDDNPPPGETQYHYQAELPIG
jgi:hypothetical protein